MPARVACERGGFAHSERQRLPQPTEELDGALPWRCNPQSTELSRLATHVGTLLDRHYTLDLLAALRRPLQRVTGT